MLDVLAGGEPGPAPVTVLPQAGDPCAAPAPPRRRRPSAVSLDEYRAHGGYAALRRAVELGPEGVIRELKDSKLQGRGGAAFPTGVKWEAVAQQPVRPHYLVCNADESEPGTFKDRVLMERDPFALIEAMTIAAYATGCERGYVYIRGEYPRAAARARGGDRARRARAATSATTCSARASRFEIEIRKGAGAYICGEETAIFESIEGNRGEPRNKPPFPVVEGLFGKPTVVNNVETLVNVLDIVLALRARLRRDRHRGLDGDEALLPLRSRRAPRRLRGAVRHDAARAARARGRRRGRQGAPVHPDGRRRGRLPAARRARPAADVRGGARGEDDARLGRRARARRDRRPAAAADADRGVLPQRVVRPVRSLPRRHGAPAGVARAARLRQDDRRRRARAGGDRRGGAVHARRVDLRPRPDGVERDRVGDRAARRCSRDATCCSRRGG